MTVYQGSCQCGAVTFEADLSLDNPVVCNCSRCRRVASVLVFTPEAKFTLKSGGDNLTEFTFNKHHIRHRFCKTCGVQGFSMATAPDGTPTAAVTSIAWTAWMGARCRQRRISTTGQRCSGRAAAIDAYELGKSEFPDH